MPVLPTGLMEDQASQAWIGHHKAVRPQLQPVVGVGLGSSPLAPGARYPHATA